MTPEQFVKGFYQERKSLLNAYLDSKKNTEVSRLIKSMNLEEEGTEKIRQILNSALSDAFYTILLGLDGESPIGERQENYKIFEEAGAELTAGELEVFAWEYFHNHKAEVDEQEADFIASLHYHSTENGGRKTPARSGYRPQIQFAFGGIQTSGEQTFLERKIVYPGDRVEAKIKLLSADHFRDSLKEGMAFDFREGSIIMGTGKILRIVKEELKKSDS